MSGILGPYYAQVAATQTLAGWMEPLTLEQRDLIAAAAYGASIEDLNRLGSYACEKITAEDRRDAIRQRVKEIELQVCERIPAEVSAEIDRATAPVVRDHSKATREQYASDQAHWARFCESHGVAPMPAEPAVLALYILETQPGAAILKRRLTALADLHRQCARILPRRDAIVMAALRHVKATSKAETKDNEQTSGT